MTTSKGKQKIIATDYSMPLAQLLVPFMKLSNNMHAEALTKAMGTTKERPPGNWADGLSVTKTYLKSLGTPMTGITLVGGSELTRVTRSPPGAGPSAVQGAAGALGSTSSKRRYRWPATLPGWSVARCGNGWSAPPPPTGPTPRPAP